MLGKLIVKLIVNSAALWVAAMLVSGIRYNSAGALLLMAIVLGVVNTVIGWPLKIITFPIAVVTLGLFILVLNAILFKFSASLVPGFLVTGWMAAFWGSIVVSVVSWVLGKLI
jgi:putative membrane protein